MAKQYSDWQRIDLHIHTDESRKTKQNDYEGTFDVDTLYQKLTTNNVEIFSLTDHNVINIDAYDRYYNRYSSEEDPLLLVGVELDIDNNGKTYHSLLVFNYSTYEKAESVHDRLEKYYNVNGMGDYERKINFDDIIKIFRKDDFFFIPHAGNTAGIIEAYKDDIASAQKMLILLQSPLEKVDEKRRAIYNDGFDKGLIEAFKNKNDYAYIEFSDNHNIASYPCKHKGGIGNHEFYYIKGSKNYETLRLAFIDPKSRIKSTAEYNSIKPLFNYIEKISIQGNRNIDESKMCFSPHLNVIIGGRSSGKSLFLDILNRKVDTLVSNGNYNRIIEDTTIKIKTRLDADYKETSHFDTTIIQINQGDIVNYFEHNSLDELAKKSEKQGDYEHARAQLSGRKQLIIGHIDAFTKAYQEAFNVKINQQNILHQITIDRLCSEEYVLKCDTSDLEKSLFKDESIAEVSALIEDTKDSIGRLLKSTIIQFNESELAQAQSFLQIISDKEKDIKIIDQNQSRIRQFYNIACAEISEANGELSIDARNKIEARENHVSLIVTISSIFKKLANLNKTIETVNDIKIEFIERIKLDDDSTLCLEVASEDKVSTSIIESIKSPGTDNLYDCIVKLLSGEVMIKNYGVNNPEDLKRKINTQLGALYSRFDQPLDYLVYSDGTTSKNNSPGFNSEKYLQVILNNPNAKLVIIDQPEDNLGNQFISDELVDLIREHKFNKQFFLVTHNPAIVVYGDAECIVLAENRENLITYKQIKLETENAQKDICGILDGGEYIFHNRSQKYNITKLLYKED